MYKYLIAHGDEFKPTENDDSVKDILQTIGSGLYLKREHDERVQGIVWSWVKTDEAETFTYEEAQKLINNSPFNHQIIPKKEEEH